MAKQELLDQNIIKMCELITPQQVLETIPINDDVKNFVIKSRA